MALFTCGARHDSSWRPRCRMTHPLGTRNITRKHTQRIRPLSTYFDAALVCGVAAFCGSRRPGVVSSAPTGREDNSPRREPWARDAPRTSKPQRGERVCRPLRGLASWGPMRTATADAVGYSLRPLSGPHSRAAWSALRPSHVPSPRSLPIGDATQVFPKTWLASPFFPEKP